MFKKTNVRIIVLAFAAVIIQMTMIPYIAIGHALPDVSVALFILIILRYPNISALNTAISIGIIKDIFSSYTFGVETVALLIPALMLPVIARKTDLDNKYVKYTIIFLFAMLSFTVAVVVISFLEGRVNLINFYFYKIMFSALYTTVISIGIDSLIKLIIPRRIVQYELF